MKALKIAVVILAIIMLVCTSQAVQRKATLANSSSVDIDTGMPYAAVLSLRKQLNP